MTEPIIKESFQNTKGIIFPHVREVAFDKQSISCNLGQFVTQTQREDNLFFNNEDGVYIYRSNLSPRIGYRIYQEFADYNFNGKQDEYLIEELQLRKIEKVKIPTGVVTLEGLIIGQEMPFHNHSKCIHEYFAKNNDISLLFDAYKEILLILKKLVEKGIYYLDVHAKNFMINQITKEINIIDFEQHLVRFDEPEYLDRILNRYIEMVNLINTNKGLDRIIGQLDYIRCFEEGIELIDKTKRQIL